ncbi:hypothetical protein [Pasteurella multocida]|uniref:hypothetical protein n=1 Tax=Pasteurella multocida TaxID=747 RepID=UPI0007EC9702|nr:hypothetical protein [Pasteurella multocida]AWY03347.1 hypothetical protein [Pasteurella phage Pm86]MCL7822582.1 hypothetical protein [Pasteurella multocida]OBP35930.1 hypothetical protein A0R74_02675 [Pasteurella multocida subsp. multocida]URH99310.1 hypothetical protein M8854_05170 [Pasteurella multocida]HDR1313764.1 hypothetical protein [Pasteurella multocida]
MIGTHAPKLFSSKVKQSALNADIIAEVPKYYICSHTISMRQKYWALPLSAAEIGIYREMTKCERENQPKKVPDIEDPRLVKQLLVPFKKSYVSVSPVPSCGVLHEISQRSFEKKIFPMYRRVIQPNFAAWSTHGEMLLEQKGRIALLVKPLRHFTKKKKSISEYITIRCRVEKMNVSSGMTAVLFPSITAIGGAVHTIERAVNKKLDFALGFKNLDFTTSGSLGNALKGKKVIPQLILDEITATADVILLLKLERGASEEEKKEVLQYLQNNPLHRIAGGTTWEYSATLETYNDNYTFIVDCSKEVEKELEQSGIDVLDVAFDKYKNRGETNEKTGLFEITEKTSVIINHTGYAFLEKPRIRPNARNNYPHAWVEPVFSLVEQEKFSKRVFWTRKEKKFGVVFNHR